ncbi:hypothetical protein Tco_0954161 [Tanacetum coccineum]|uniref:Uncharacterized protein n=1 Tax=Tanacetum coccineum TaxID=301880 RepID=A0ABQ5E1Y5_9ASTR
MLNFEKQIVLKQEIDQREFVTHWDPDAALKRNVQKRLSEEFKPLASKINVQLNNFKKSIVKEIKDDLKYVLSLEDEFDGKCLIFDIQTEFFKAQFESTISESYSQVYENNMFEQNSSLESENCCLKKTITQFQQYFSKLEAHCINLELQLRNNVLKSGQHGQMLNKTSNEAKIKTDIHVIESINIELEGLRWIPTGKTIGTCLNTDDSAIPLGKETCSPKYVIRVNSSSLSADTSMASEPISSKDSPDAHFKEKCMLQCALSQKEEKSSSS